MSGRDYVGLLRAKKNLNKNSINSKGAILKILLIVYDNDAHIFIFPLGLAYLASACRNAGHEVKIYNQDVYHWPEEHLTELLNKERFDVAGVGVIGGYYQHRKLLKISEVVNKSEQRPFFVIGCHGPSPEAEYFLRKTQADTAVIGEGEVTIVDLLKTLEEKGDLVQVQGIVFFKDEKFIQHPGGRLLKILIRFLFPLRIYFRWTITP